MTDIPSLINVIQKCEPQEIYNLAAQSHVRVSFDQPIYTSNVTGLGVLNLLESVRLTDPKIKIYQASSSELGNLDASRDWGHAKDYVKAMWLILQHDTPDDFVCSTGISHSVKDLVIYVFTYLELDWKQYVSVDKKYLRPEELNHLKGDCSKIKKILGWSLEYSFESMMDEMIESWLNKLKKTKKQ